MIARYDGKILSIILVVIICAIYFAFVKSISITTSNAPSREAAAAFGKVALHPDMHAETGMTDKAARDRTTTGGLSPRKGVESEILDQEKLERLFTGLQECLQRREINRLTELWSRDSGVAQTIAISLSAPSIADIGEISGDISSFFEQIPASQKKDLRKRAQKLYDKFTIFPEPFRVVYGSISNTIPNSITITEIDVKSLDDIKPTESGEISFHGRARSRIESLDVLNSNSRYGYLFKREPESELPTRK